MRTSVTLWGLTLTLAVVSGTARADGVPSTLAHVRAVNLLRCGIDIEEAEYSTSDDHGNVEQFDIDICRAVAVAILGKDARVALIRYPDDRAAMRGLNNNEVELIATLTDDFSHAAGNHLQHARPIFWDGVGFLVLDPGPAMVAHQLSGKKICFLAETAVEDKVRSWFAREHLDFAPFPFQEEGEMLAAFSTGNCGALAGDQTRLAQTRVALAQHGKPSHLLLDRLSDDPLAPAYRDSDPQWAAIVNWVMEALIQAEKYKVTQANVVAMRSKIAHDDDHEPELRFLLGRSREIGAMLGLNDEWVVHVLEATGNYGEIYERDLGWGSPLKLPRGVNNLLENGGSMMPLPAR